MVNLFPYSQLWRIGTKQHSSNKCSTYLSIVILLAVGGLIAQSLVKVLKKQTITASSHVEYNTFPLKTTISTYEESHQSHHPYMLAFDLEDLNQGIDISTLSFAATYQTLDGEINNRTSNSTPINLEKCTKDHFSSVPKVQAQFEYLRAQTWYCLPINSTFDIQGDKALSGIYSGLNIIFNCSGSCTPKSYNIWMYFLDVVINPTNNTEPEHFFLNEVSIPITPNTYKQFSFKLTESVISTDNSLFPWADIEMIKTLSSDTLKTERTDNNVNFSGTIISIERSKKTMDYNRHYLKFLDVLSFIGGTFQAILGAFFFMSILGRMFFQYKFAKSFFRLDIVEKFTSSDFIQQVTFNMMNTLRCKPDWKDSIQREQLRKTVNKLLDITYLNKRINFLEKALTILLQDHQIKALFLLNNATKEETDEKYQFHSFRDRMIYFLSQKNLESKFMGFLSKKMSNPGEIKPQTDQTLKKESSQFQRVDIDMGPPLRKNGQVSRYPCLRNKPSAQQRGRQNKVNQSLQQLGRNKRIQIQSKDEKEEMAYRNMRINLKYIDDMGHDQLQEKELREWISTDFRQLQSEAKNPYGDYRSKKIYEKMEEWLVYLISETAAENRSEEEIVRYKASGQS